MEYIERELAKDKEKNLCHTRAARRARMASARRWFNMEIVQAGPNCYRSRFCATQETLLQVVIVRRRRLTWSSTPDIDHAEKCVRSLRWNIIDAPLNASLL